MGAKIGARPIRTTPLVDRTREAKASSGSPRLRLGPSSRISGLRAGTCRLLAGIFAVTLASAAAAGDWPQFQRDASRAADATADVIRTPVAAAWSVPVSSEVFGFASAVLTQGAVYAGSPAGLLRAVDARTGAARWTFQTDGAIHSAPAATEAAVYFGSADGTLRALDPATGGLLWTLETGNNIHASPAFDGGVVYAASNSGLLYAVDAASGGVRWSTELDGDYIWSSPAVDATRVYAATLGGKVFAVDRFTGAPLWTVTLPAQVRAAPVAAGDALYIGAYDGVLRALDPRDGSTRWSHTAAAPIVGSPAVSSTTVYFASLDGKVTALKRADGSVRWSYQAAGEAYSSPALIGGVLVVGSTDKTLHLLDAASGASVQSEVLSGRIVSAAALSRGRIAVLTDDGRLHAFKSPNLPPLAPAGLRVNGGIRPAINTASAAFSWSFADPDAGDAQEAFVLQVATSSAGFDQPVLDIGSVASASAAFVLASPLPEGSYVWRVRAYDLFNDSGPFASGESFLWDRTRPQVAIGSPAGGETFVASRDSIRVSFTVADNLDPAPRIDAALVQLADEGSPRGGRAARVEVNGSSVLEPLSIDDGVWRLELTAVDFAGNVSTASSGAFTVLHDVRAPRTWIAVSTPQASGNPGAPVFITRHTPLNLSSIDDLVVEGDAIGLGVAFQRLSVDGIARSTFTNPSPAAGQVFSSTFALASDPDGLRVISALAQDTLGNVEPARIATVAVDNTAPITAFSLEGARFPGSDAGSQYVSTATRIAFAGHDPLVGGVASGLARASWQDNGGPLQAYTSPFTLPEGVHALGYRSQDALGNSEVLRSTTVLVDGTAPASAVSIGFPHYIDGGGVQYVSPATPVSFSASDPALAGGQAGSGVGRIEVSIDGGAFVAYAGALTLPEGRHAILYRAIDNVSNIETARTLLLRSDAAAPVTALQANGSFYSIAAPEGQKTYAPQGFLYGFSATDPVSNEVASGVSFTRYRTGPVAGFGTAAQYAPEAFQNFASSFSLAEGIRRIEFQSQDNVSNLELLKAATVFVDNTPPDTALSVGLPRFDSGARVFVATSTLLALTSQDPVVQEVASGVRVISFRRGAEPYGAYAQAFGVAGPDGLSSVDWSASDQVGNAEVARSTMVALDSTPPRTTLAARGGAQFGGPLPGASYASSDTRFELVAVDPVVNGVAAGVAVSRFSDNGGPPQVFGEPFPLAEGAHRLAYQSRDRVENTETLRDAEVLIDATPPVTSVQVGSPHFVAPDGTRTLTPATPVTLSAEDPALPTGQGGSGLSRIEVSVDGGAFLAYAGPLTFAEGRHTLLYRAVDKVGNVETTHALAVRSDASAPLTALAVAGGRQFPGPDAGTFFASPDTFYSLPAADPLARDVASGLAFTRWRDNGGAFALYASPFGLSEGVHALDYESQDNVGNLEVRRSTRALVDATPPRTTLAVLGGVQQPGPDGATFYASSATRYALSAFDPVGGEVASGVALTEYQDNGGAFSAFSTPFRLAEGAHALAYRSQDNVANLETARSTNAWVDATPPVTSFEFGAPYYRAPSGASYVTSATPITFASGDPALPTGQPGSGVDRIEVGLDGGAFAVYGAAVFLGNGDHSLRYRGIDRVGNMEDARSLEATADNAAPLLSFAFSRAPVVRPPAGEFWFPSDLSIIWSATDTASGLAFSEPETFVTAEGRGLEFAGRAEDNVGNVSYSTATVNLDKTPPSVDAGRPFEVFEGHAARFDAAVTDNLDNAVQFSWSFGDGGVAGREFRPSRVYADNGVFETVLTAIDHAGHVSTGSVRVSVLNAQPTVEAGEDRFAAEGAYVAISSTFSDAGRLDTHAAAVDWGDGTSSAGTVSEADGTGSVSAGHVYGDNGTYVVTVTVTDKDGGTGQDTLQVTVANVAPTLVSLPSVRSDEGGPVELPPAAFSDPGFDHSAGGTREDFTATVDWGDGTTEPAADVVLLKTPGGEGRLTRGTIQAKHAYGDDGAYPVTVTVRDDDGGLATTTFTVTVDNVAPALASLPSLEADEGSFIELPAATFSDPGFDNGPGGTREDFSATIDWGDGTSEPAGEIVLAETPGGEGAPTRGNIQARHAYGDNGTYPVTVTLRDDDGGVATSTFTVTVDNLAPSLASLPGLRTNEGALLQLPPAAFTDPGFDNPPGDTREDFTATIDWGDGSTEPVGDIALTETSGAEGALTRGTVQARHAYADDGAYAVTIRVRDDDGGVATSTFGVTVDNAAPTLASLPSLKVDEGSFIQLPPAAFADPGFDNPAGGTREDFTAAIDWGDGTSEPAADISLAEQPGGEGVLTRGTVQARHAYGDNGSYPVTVTVQDDDGGVATSTFTVAVENAAPALAGLPDVRTDEGSFIELPPAAFADPGFDNPAGGTREDFTATIDWGDGTSEPVGDIALVRAAGGEGARTQGAIRARHAYGDDGTYAVIVTVRDDDGGSDSKRFAVTVANVAPIVKAGPAQAAKEGDFVSLAPAFFTDPGFDVPAAGTGETFSATIDWGDGNVEPLSDISMATNPGAEGTATTGAVQARHAYGDNGRYTVSVCVKDDDAGEGCDRLLVDVSNVSPAVRAGEDLIAAAGGELHLGGAVAVRTIRAAVPGQAELQDLPLGPSEPVAAAPASYSDPGFDNPAGATREDFAGTVLWGDGAADHEPAVTETETPGQEGAPTTGTLAAKHRYAANGIYVLSAGAEDDDGGAGSGLLRVTVDREPPITTISHQGPISIEPGIPSNAAVFLGPQAASLLSAEDPPVNGVAFGVQWTFRRDPAFGADPPFTVSTGPFRLGEEGVHRLEWFSVDLRGNEEARRFKLIAVDATPPDTVLDIGAPRHRLADGTVLVSSRTAFSLTAADPISASVASGLRETRLRTFEGTASTGPFNPYSGPFLLGGGNGPVAIEFYSTDKVQNAESVRSSTVLLDSQPPELAFQCPPEAGLGICRVVRGRFPILGTATDLHLREYRLEFAPGKDAIQGFAPIHIGAGPIASGALGAWDASGLQGWHTLRLTASDQVGNYSVLALSVWVGDPATLMLLGNHDLFKMPEGVAVGTDGRIYVADRNNDRIGVFTATGAFVTSFGAGNAKTESTTTVSLNKPSGVTVDAAGVVIVADTNNDRVLKLSADGRLSLGLGRRNPSGNWMPGKDPGEFNKPAAVALDRAGAIHVADGENRRVQVFSSSGAFLREMLLPATDPAREDSRGKPAGIAVDGSGRIYVTDSQGGRLVVFGADGGLLGQFPIPPAEPGSISAPSGVAVSPSGDCLLVSDAHSGRVLKLDRNGASNLTFGQKHKIDERATTAIRLRKPLGLALDGEGNLYVADRNASQIKKFGLPTGEPTLAVPPSRPGDDYYVAKDVVTMDEGGLVERKDKAAVVIPAGAVPEDLQIAVSTPSSAKVVVADKDMRIVSVPVEFQPHGTQFNSAVTLVIPYDSALVEAYKASEKQLQVHYWNPDKNKWEQLVSVVDPVAKVVTAKTLHFSLYQVMAATGTLAPTAAAAADSTFGFRDLYVFPDPAVRGAVPTFHVAVGIADVVKLKVFDVAGRQVHSAALDRAPAIIDDGSGPKYAYEHAWRGHIPSGLYFFTLEAEKGGHATIRKAGRFAVVR